jgi:hypothetical protein
LKNARMAKLLTMLTTSQVRRLHQNAPTAINSSISEAIAIVGRSVCGPDQRHVRFECTVAVRRDEGRVSSSIGVVEVQARRGRFLSPNFFSPSRAVDPSARRNEVEQRRVEIDDQDSMDSTHP